MSHKDRCAPSDPVTATDRPHNPSVPFVYPHSPPTSVTGHLLDGMKSTYLYTIRPRLRYNRPCDTHPCNHGADPSPPWHEALAYRHTPPLEYLMPKRARHEQLRAPSSIRTPRAQRRAVFVLLPEATISSLGDHEYWIMPDSQDNDCDIGDCLINRARLYGDGRAFAIVLAETSPRND